MALFLIIEVFIPETNKYNTARAFIGFVLPLIAGGLSAYGFLADSALELQFTTQRPAWQMIVERLGTILSVIGLTSLVFQMIVAMMGISLAPLGGIIQRQLIWFVPCLTLLILGGATSLMAKSSSGGFALVGGVWIFQLIARGWFARKPVLRNILIFYGAMDPLSRQRVYNQATLITPFTAAAGGDLCFTHKTRTIYLKDIVMIIIKNLYKTYGKGGKAVTALKGIDLSIGEGMYGLLGPNGAGKTTLMRILAGIVDASKGSVLVDNIDIRTDKGKRQMKETLGYLPQELGLYPDLTARQFVDYMAILKGVDSTGKRKKRVQEVLEMVSLISVADRKIKGYSGGMKRRVGIAQALVNDPKLLIVDEPTAGLDPEERIRFRNLLVNLAANRVVLLSTHIVGDIGQTCRNMAVLSEGNLCYEGSPVELMQLAEGHVWTISSADGVKPNDGLTVVSLQHMPDGMKYRVVGEHVDRYPDVVAEHPSLEDGYVWLMKSRS